MYLQARRSRPGRRERLNYAEKDGQQREEGAAHCFRYEKLRCSGGCSVQSLNYCLRSLRLRPDSLTGY